MLIIPLVRRLERKASWNGWLVLSLTTQSEALAKFMAVLEALERAFKETVTAKQYNKVVRQPGPAVVQTHEGKAPKTLDH